MAIQVRNLTYDDLLQLREARDEQLELIDGELFVTPSPTRLHQLVSKRLSRLLQIIVDDAGIGEFYYSPYDVKLAQNSVVQPDLFVVLRENASRLTESGVEGAPDFAIEIVSPSTGHKDLLLKRALYAQHGVREFWLVDPAQRSVTAHSQPEQGIYRTERSFDAEATSSVVPGLTTALSDLFSPYPD